MGGVKKEDQYRNKVILAPMVRVCTLPMRLLALDYGVDLVYTEEIIDRKLLMCQKHDNELLGTTDFTLSDGTVVFRTCPREKAKLVFQIGTSDAKRALAAAKKIQDYVSGVDINMGCPKEFSIKGGMGAALITQPEKVKNILTTLVEELNVPVTCKIRVLPKLEETVQLARLIESTGVSAIAVHGRTKEERSRDVNRDDYIKAIVAAVNIPVIANGGSKTISCISDIATFQHRTGASSVMVARAAEWNCSVFRKDGPLPVLDVLRSYLQLAFLYDNNETNTKYNVLQIVRSKMTELEQADKSLTAKSLEDFANIWDMKTEYMDIMEARRVREQDLTTQIVDENCGAKRCRTTSGAVLIELPVRFDKRFYSTKMSPKQILNNWLKKCNGDKAVYDTVERENDRCFNSTVNVGGTLYTNPYWEKSKQRAEQGAAICCLIANGESDGCLSKPCSETEDLKRKWIATIHASDNDEPSEKSQKVSNEDGAGPVN